MNRVRTVGRLILDRYEHKFFWLDRIIADSKFSRKQVIDILTTFRLEGLIRLVKKVKKPEKEYGQPPSYSILYRVADRKRMASRIAPRQFENTTQDRMWFIIRKRRVFTLRDLTVLSGVVKSMVRWYLKTLRRAGIIERSRSGGGPGVYWTLLKDTGPRRPYIGDKVREIGK
jgi:DNA-binding transcriptional ArsR family regulator